MITPDQIDVKPEYREAYLKAYDRPSNSVLESINQGIAALLAYLSNNPIEPTGEEQDKLFTSWIALKNRSILRAVYYTVEWQRRMFLKRDLGLPEELAKELALHYTRPGVTEQLVRKAYELGLKNGGSK